MIADAGWRTIPLLRGRPEHHAGHNPAGALAIVALLGLAVLVTAAGWATYHEVGGEWLEELHEGAANAMLALVGLHVFAVIASSVLHRENLVRAMVDGRKRARAEDAIGRTRPLVGVLLAATVFGAWWLMWQSAPPSSAAGSVPAAMHAGPRDRDHDDD